MNLTIKPLRYKGVFCGNNTKTGTAANNNCYEENKNDGSKAIKNYVTASINLNNNSSEKPQKQVLTGDEFFINMVDYKKNEDWAKKMIKLLQSVSDDVSSGLDFTIILEKIENAINSINSTPNFKSFTYGIRRTSCHVFTPKESSRGDEYVERYLNKCKTCGQTIINERGKQTEFTPNSNKEYKEANTSKITAVCISENSKPLLKISEDMPCYYKISNLSLAEKEYNKLRQIKNPSVDEVLRSCAIIQWLITQETPYKRGTDSIANILAKSIMHANGIFISPLKDGISLDFEAFDTDLDDYIEKYPNFFKVKPYKIKG